MKVRINSLAVIPACSVKAFLIHSGWDGSLSGENSIILLWNLSARNVLKNFKKPMMMATMTMMIMTMKGGRMIKATDSGKNDKWKNKLSFINHRFRRKSIQMRKDRRRIRSTIPDTPAFMRSSNCNGRIQKTPTLDTLIHPYPPSSIPSPFCSSSTTRPNPHFP